MTRPCERCRKRFDMSVGYNTCPTCKWRTYVAPGQTIRRLFGK